MRKFFIIGLILMLFFTCAAVSAEDTISEDIVSDTVDEVAIPETVDNDRGIDEEQTIVESSEEEILGADEGSFTELQEQINNAEIDSTITLEKNYTRDSGFDLDGISFDKALTIDGNGYTVNAYDSGRIFNIGDKNVIIKNMILINAYGSGGAMNGGLAINCTFSNNKAGWGFGGAAMCNGTAINCTFTNNYATEGNAALENGTAINCTFKSNRAGYLGGAMSGNAINCTFMDNSAPSGGAMYEGNATNCNFVNNRASYGGAMYGGYAENCNFTNNHASNLGPATYKTTLKDCNFKNNTDGVTHIQASPLTIVYNKYGYLIITLKDSQGKPIPNAEVYYGARSDVGYTDSNGQRKFRISGLAPKKYTFHIIYEGDGYYSESRLAVNVTVKKATPKITAKTKTFKKKTKVKKYTITLKNNINKVLKSRKVYIKVKGKTYTAKTNSKGKATFKIKNLKKKGTFKATISYKGNKYYNKVTKKVKIKVK